MAEIFDFEVLIDALSFEIKTNTGVKNFESMALCVNVRYSHGPSLKQQKYVLLVRMNYEIFIALSKYGN